MRAAWFHAARILSLDFFVYCYPYLTLIVGIGRIGRRIDLKLHASRIFVLRALGEELRNYPVVGINERIGHSAAARKHRICVCRNVYHLQIAVPKYLCELQIHPSYSHTHFL